MKFFATNGHKHFDTNVISMAIIEISTIGNFIDRDIGKCYKNIKIPYTITVSVCYYIS